MRKFGYIALLSTPLLLLFLPNFVWANDGFNIGFHIPPNKKSVTIPIEVHNNLILLPISVNNSPALNFILDTGVNTTIIIESNIAAFLPQAHKRSIKIVGLGKGEPIEANLYGGINMNLLGIQGRGITLMVLPPNTLSFSQMFGKSVHGIIGYELFKNFVVEINYVGQYIRLFRPSKYKVKGKKKKIIPMGIEKTKPYINAQITTIDGATIDTKLLIDTGASMAVSIWDEDRHVPDKTIYSYLGQGLSGDIFGELGRIPSFKMGDFNFENVIMAYPEKESVKFVVNNATLRNGNLGAEILRRIHVTFDYPNKRLILRKNGNFKKPFEYKKSGIEVIVRDNGYKIFIVDYIRPDSPAAQADIQVGDVLLTINGIVTFFASIGQVYAYLDRKAGKHVRLKILRNGQKLKKCMLMWDEI